MTRWFRRPWPLSHWILTGMLLAATGTVVVTLLVALLISATRQVDEASVAAEQRALQARSQLFALIERDVDDWAHAIWQANLSPLLSEAKIELALFTPNGQRLFASPGLTTATVDTAEQANAGQLHRFVVDEAGNVQGLVLYRPAPLVRTYREPPVWLALTALLVVALVVSAGIVWFVSSLALGPLRRLQAAVVRMGAGDLSVSLPSARVREVQELAAGIDAMRLGLRDAITRQAELEQERKELVAGISHDLRTPLASVRGYLEGIRDSVATTPEEVSRYVEISLDKTAYLERLVQDLYDYARTDYLPSGPDLAPLALEQLLAGWVDSFLPAAERRGITLVVEAGDAAPVLGDSGQLQRLVANLLDNAIRHTPVGGLIVVGWTVTGPTLSLWVADTGEGIPAEEIDRVFEPGYHRSGSSHSGSGLGLAIVRRVARAHGGDAHVESVPGQGSRFWVVLPVQIQKDGERSDEPPLNA